jgi:hypothetical protein
MTILFPRLNSADLEPYVAPFGRMMLAFGRATTAAIELVEKCKGSEAEAVRFVSTTSAKDLPKKLRELLKNKLDKEQDEKLRHAAAEYKAVADERHHLIHGEWWFNVFEKGVLTVRNVRWKKNNSALIIENREVVSPADLDQWAARLDAVADDFDDLAWALGDSGGKSIPGRLERRGAFMLACVMALLAIVLAVWFIAAARAEPSTSRSFYDRSRSFAGSSVTRGNSTSFTDRNGRFDGAAIKNSDGTTSLYDRNGHFTGSVTNTSPRR